MNISNKSSGSDKSDSGERDRSGDDLLGLDLDEDTGRSGVSSSPGVGRRSKELEEADVRAEVEEDDLFVVIDQEDTVVVFNRCSKFVEVASRLDVRRTAEVVD